MTFMKLNLDWEKTVVFCVVFLCVTLLVWAGKIPAEYIKYLFVWLVPSPVQLNQAQRDEQERPG